jgi:hypothetical protein
MFPEMEKPPSKRVQRYLMQAMLHLGAAADARLAGDRPAEMEALGAASEAVEGAAEFWCIEVEGEITPQVVAVLRDFVGKSLQVLWRGTRVELITPDPTPAEEQMILALHELRRAARVRMQRPDDRVAECGHVLEAMTLLEAAYEKRHLSDGGLFHTALPLLRDVVSSHYRALREAAAPNTST